MNKKRIIWLSIGLLVAIIFIVRAYNKSNQATEVSTYKVVKRTITEVVSVTGKIQPEFELKISPDVSGEITEMLVKEGDSVTKGQLLLRINPELYQTTMSQLKANLDNAKASLAGSEAQQIKAKMALAQAEANFKRQQKLHEQKVISDQDWENARLQFENAQADFTIAAKTILSAQYNVKSLMARVDEGSKNLGRTSIYAPVSGIVTQLNSEKGERVVGTAQMAGTEIMRISNLNSMEVQVNINENDIVRVHRGDSANIKVDAYEDRVFKGIVTENVLSIPISALTTRNPVVQKEETTTVTKKETEIVTWVFLFNNGISKAVKIKTGVQDIDYFEVIEGLKEGDEVISEPSMAIAKTLNDGDKVKKKK